MLEFIGKMIANPAEAISSIIGGGLSGIAGISEAKGGASTVALTEAIEKGTKMSVQQKNLQAAEIRASKGFITPPAQEPSKFAKEVVQVINYIGNDTDAKEALLAQLEKQGNKQMALYYKGSGGGVEMDQAKPPTIKIE